jgi:sigma-B regulation protein RsbU (phosphoserine phosphatase)
VAVTAMELIGTGAQAQPDKDMLVVGQLQFLKNFHPLIQVNNTKRLQISYGLLPIQWDVSSGDPTLGVSAQAIQQQLLPKTSSHLANLAISGRCSPCGSVGGDYFDFFTMLDGSVGFVVGDASGHGMGAALVIAATRAYLRALTLSPNNPAKILALTNLLLAQDLAGDHFVTLLFVQIDPIARSLQYSGAGHHPGYVLSKCGDIKAILISDSLPLGIESAIQFPAGQKHVDLESGDLVFLYSDGIVEAAADDGDEPFGINRALNCLRSHKHESLDAMLDALYTAIADFSRECEQSDDITALLIRI